MARRADDRHAEAGFHNTLKLENGAGDAGGVNIDSYAISDYTPGDYEAEQGAVGGGAAIQGAHVGQMHQSGAWNQIGIVDGLGGGTKTLVVRYATNEAGVVKSLYERRVCASRELPRDGGGRWRHAGGDPR
ncbi:MAG: hypothetical protein IPP09_10775 [Elusimicrobia bacterium]|nr:hypothetical protein [Elusimicrobiota bacterium]